MYLNIQKASIKIGPLECKGKSEAMNNGGSCQSLKSQGRSSGYYILDTSQDNRYTEDSYRYLKIRQGWKKSKFSEWPAEFSVISSDKSKNFLLKKFLKILQNGGAHGGSKPFMRELLPP